MKTTRLFAALALASLAAAASAQSLGTITQRDANQETRIRDGLQDGSLTTRESAVLQRDESHVDRMQANDLKDGKLTGQEREHITQAQEKVSRDIAAARHNGVNGDPLSASSQRMQQATQRDINQQQRIANGVKDDQLTNHETGRLEAGQAHTDRREFAAGRDGHVSAGEARGVRMAHNHQSVRIHQLRTNGLHRRG